MSEHSYAVQPRSTEAIAIAAERFLAQYAPDYLASGRPLDLAYLVDYGLQKEKIAVYPVSDEELPSAEAETRAGEDGWVEIWVREEFFAALFTVNSSTKRARCTLAHEIGHALLHRADVRTGRHSPNALALRRALRSELKAFNDSEWQAFTFAGALLMPRPALRKIAITDVAAVAGQFDVSEAFARSHLKRILRVL